LAPAVSARRFDKKSWKGRSAYHQVKYSSQKWHMHQLLRIQLS